MDKVDKAVLEEEPPFTNRCSQEKEGLEMEKLNSSTIIVEPFLSGSHAQLCETLKQAPTTCKVVGWPGTAKWHWRMLVSASYFAHEITKDDGEKVETIIFSAMMNVSELLGLRPDLTKAKKILYFHENQLEYPRQSSNAKQSIGQSAFNLGWNQIVSCLCVDEIVFNSTYNMESFFKLIPSFLNKIPSKNRPPAIDISMLRSKAKVLGVPITVKLQCRAILSSMDVRREPLRVVWPHRFEHDKGCEEWISTLEEFSQLDDHHVIEVYILGETTASGQDAADKARSKVQSLSNVHIKQWGRVESRQDYIDLLCQMDVAVSTARHEFYGIAMLEAATCGCLPLCPNRLSYPELFPSDCLYRTQRQLVKRLRDFATRPDLPGKKMTDPAWTERLAKFQWNEGKGELAQRWGLLTKNST